jgi:hypothetical protein
MLYSPTDYWAAKPEKVPGRESRLGVLARCRLPSLLKAGRRRAFIRVYLWAAVADFRAAHPELGRANGLFRPAPTRFRFEGKSEIVVPVACLGKLHLCLDVVSLEHVAHELGHALVRRLQARSPEPHEVLEQIEGASFYGGRADEEICYDLGRWVAALHAWVLYYSQIAPNRSRRRRG